VHRYGHDTTLLTVLLMICVFVCKEFSLVFYYSFAKHSALMMNNNFDDDHQQRSQPTSSLTWPRFMTG
jgi:hypothetical protein